MWQPIIFTLKVCFRSAKKLFLLYLFLQTLLALTYVIDLISYKEVIDSINNADTLLGLSIYGVIVVLLIYYLLYKVVDGVTNYIWCLLDARQSVSLNGKFIDKLSSLDLSIFENPQNVGLANRAFNRFQFQFKYYLKAIVDVYTSVIKLLIHLSIFFFVSPLLTLIIIFANFIHIFVNSKQATSKFLIYRADDETKRKFEYVVGTLFSKDTLAEIKLYRAFGFFKEKLVRLYKHYIDNQLRIEKKHQIYNALAAFLPTISIFIYTLYIADQALNGQITTGYFLFLFINSLTFNGTLFNMGQNLGHLHADSLFMKDAIDYYDLKSHITFPVISKSQKDELITQLDKPVIRIENVSFKYPQGKDFVLKNISLEIPYGQNLALIGENGAGKTTLVKLLLRTYDPIEGNIFINNVNIKNIPEEVIFATYSTLFQSYGKFYFTIKENLEMASGRKLTDEEIIKYLNFSNSWEFIKNTKDKLNQQLGSEFTFGIDLSGGQWQRLAIARAYAKKTPVLILDEPTSNVDARSEMEIFDRLNRERKENTLIFISHRFSTIKDAERIVVLDKGKIIEDGNHEKLMKNKGKYHSLYTIQAERYKRH